MSDSRTARVGWWAYFPLLIPAGLLVAGLVGAFTFLGLYVVIPAGSPGPEFGLDPLILTGELAAVAFSPDGRYVVGGTRGTGDTRQPNDGGDVTVWEIATRRRVATVRLRQWVTALSIHPAGDRLLVAASYVDTSRQANPPPAREEAGEVHVFSFPDLRAQATATLETNVGWARYAPNGTTVGVVKLWREPGEVRFRGDDVFGELALLDADTLADKGIVGKSHRPAAAFAFTPDGRQVITGLLRRQEILAFDVVTGDLRAKLGRNSPGTFMEVSPDGRELLCGGFGFWVYDFEQNAFSIGPNDADWIKAQVACYTPDGQSFLTAWTEGSKRYARSTVALVDRATRETRTVFKDRECRMIMTCCAYSPNGRHFAVGTDVYRERPEDPFRGRVLLFTATAP